MIHLYAVIVFFFALGIVAAAADADQRRRAPADRYQRLADHADQGIGLDEFQGHRRFTRYTDTRTPSTHSAKNPVEGTDQNPGKRTSRA